MVDLAIKDYLKNRCDYKIDFNYQRPPGVWSKEDKQCLIDSILKGKPIPLFFFNYSTKEKVYYIVDGQQRLHAIEEFHSNKWGLNEEFSGKEKAGKKFNGGDKVISKSERDDFLDYKLQVYVFIDLDDELVRENFSRLQRGSPLQIGERLNAKPGDIVKRMRELARMSFLSKSIGVSRNRYGHYPDAARILFYEKKGCKEMGTKALNDFFKEYKNIEEKDNDFLTSQSVLRFLGESFPPDPGDYKYLSKHAWVVAIYTMIRELWRKYSLNGQRENLKKFIEDFHGIIYSEQLRSSNREYQRFYENVRGGWSERIISLRRDILVVEFIKKFNPPELDEQRQISEEQKVECYTHTDKKCEDCKCCFKDYKEPEYHHEIRHTDGGLSKPVNIRVLCADCHSKRHSKINRE